MFSVSNIIQFPIDEFFKNQLKVFYRRWWLIWLDSNTIDLFKRFYSIDGSPCHNSAFLLQALRLKKKKTFVFSCGV